MSELNSVQHLRKSGSLPLSRHIYTLFSLIVLFAFSLTLDRFNLISSLSISSPVYLLLIPPPPLPLSRCFQAQILQYPLSRFLIPGLINQIRARWWWEVGRWACTSQTWELGQRGEEGRVGETQTHHPHEETYIKAAAAPPIGGKSLICWEGSWARSQPPTNLTFSCPGPLCAFSRQKCRFRSICLNLLLFAKSCFLMFYFNSYFSFMLHRDEILWDTL